MGKQLKPDVKERLRAAKRASRLRAKQRRGTITPQEQDELGAIETRWPRKARGRPRVEDRVDSLPAPEQDSIPVASGEEPAPPAVDASPLADSGEATEPPARPAPPPPPTVPIPEVERGAGRAANWRAKYRSGMGREATCIQVGQLYCSLLARASAYVESTGASPLISPADIERLILPAAVLTADALLPPDFEVSPEVELCAMSALVLGQAARVAYRERRKARVTAPFRPRPTIVRDPDPSPDPVETSAPTAPLAADIEPPAPPEPHDQEKLPLVRDDFKLSADAII